MDSLMFIWSIIIRTILAVVCHSILCFDSYVKQCNLKRKLIKQFVLGLKSFNFELISSRVYYFRTANPNIICNVLDTFTSHSQLSLRINIAPKEHSLELLKNVSSYTIAVFTFIEIINNVCNRLASLMWQ